jgi:hypothetical protein
MAAALQPGIAKKSLKPQCVNPLATMNREIIA